MRLAGRNPDALEQQLPALSALHRVVVAGVPDDAARVHFILHRLIPEYLTRLPAGRDCRAIRELLTWEDDDGEVQSLTTRYHKAAAHLIHAASDFGRRQEPRLLHECARRFIAFDHEDRLGTSPPSAEPTCPASIGADVETQGAGLRFLPVDDPRGGIVRVHSNLDYHLLIDRIAGAERIVLLNTWIPGIDILADALVDALAGGATVSVLMLHPDSQIARLRSQALQGAVQQRFHQDRVRPGIRHCLDVLAATSRMVSADHRPNLRVALYHSLPSICVYGIDERSFVSFFLHGQLAIKSTQIEITGQESVLGQLVVRETEMLWSLAHEIDDIADWAAETQRARRRLRNLDAEHRVKEPAVVATG